MKKCILIVFVLSAKIIIVRENKFKKDTTRVLQPDGVFFYENMKLEKIIIWALGKRASEHVSQSGSRNNIFSLAGFFLSFYGGAR